MSVSVSVSWNSTYTAHRKTTGDRVCIDATETDHESAL